MKEQVEIPQTLKEQAEAQILALGGGTDEEHMAQMVKALGDYHDWVFIITSEFLGSDVAKCMCEFNSDDILLLDHGFMTSKLIYFKNIIGETVRLKLLLLVQDLHIATTPLYTSSCFTALFLPVPAWHRHRMRFAKCRMKLKILTRDCSRNCNRKKLRIRIERTTAVVGEDVAAAEAVAVAVAGVGEDRKVV